MISSDVIRGYIDTMILFTLLKEPSYGYAISRQISTLTQGQYVIKETTLYSAFARLLKQGCLQSFSGDESFGRQRTYYRITDAGRAYYREKCREWELTLRVIEPFIQENGEEEIK